MNEVRHGNIRFLNSVLVTLLTDKALVESLNSERALQATVYAALNQQQSDVARRILVEPEIYEAMRPPTHLGSYIPDLLVVRRLENEAIIDLGIELKFEPWGDVEFEKDIEKLIAYGEMEAIKVRAGCDLSNGPSKREEWLSISSESTVWAFVAIGQFASEVAWPRDVEKKVPSCLGRGIVHACLAARSPRSSLDNPCPELRIHILGSDEPLEVRQVT